MATLQTGNACAETFGTTSPVTGAVPSVVDGTYGFPVQGFAACCLTVSAPVGQTFSGAGTFDCYCLYAAVGRWSRFPSGDFPAPSAVRDYTFDPCDLIGRAKNSYLIWVPTGVTFSGGATGVATVIQGVPQGDVKSWG